MVALLEVVDARSVPCLFGSDLFGVQRWDPLDRRVLHHHVSTQVNRSFGWELALLALYSLHVYLAASFGSQVLSVGLQRGVTCVNREGAIRVGNLKRLKHHGNPLLGLSDTCALYWNNCLYESKMFPSQKSTNMMENVAQSGRMLRWWAEWFARHISSCERCQMKL